jgi:hypothetical protein
MAFCHRFCEPFAGDEAAIRPKVSVLSGPSQDLKLRRHEVLSRAFAKRT